jgi:hypothetical protein
VDPEVVGSRPIVRPKIKYPEILDILFWNAPMGLEPTSG